MSSSYDDIAGMYNAFWADWYLPAALPALETLFFSRMGRAAKILDLCCGSGHVTQELVKRGYIVTGVDNSAALIELARQRLPGVDFQVQDARDLHFSERFTGALSTFDSLNHILRSEELQEVFLATYRNLLPGGIFVFDMNLEDAYHQDLKQWQATVGNKSAGLVRGSYDSSTKIASTELVWFTQREGSDLWERHSSVVQQRCYPQNEILSALSSAGFQQLEAIKAEDAGMRQDMATGRIFLVAQRQE